jgi:hypothetical protein
LQSRLTAACNWNTLDKKDNVAVKSAKLYLDAALLNWGGWRLKDQSTK